MKIMAVLAVAGLAAAANAQTSILYLTNIDSGHLQAYQGGSLLWDEPLAYGGAFRESPIAVVDGVIRTTGLANGMNGGQYDLNGIPTPITYPNPTPASSNRSFDSTSDGRFNYLVSFDTGEVYRTSTTYVGATLLFTASGDRHEGITYDPKGSSSNGSLWISNALSGWVTEYDMLGVPLSSFNTGLSNQSALALDHADDTLWLVNQQTTTAYQFSRTGLPMGNFFSSDLQGVFGGEFHIPAPGSLAVLGLGGLAAARRRRT